MLARGLILARALHVVRYAAAADFPNRMSGRDRSRPAARPLIHDVGILRIALMDAD